MPSFVEAKLDGIRLFVRIQPRSSRNRVVGLHGDRLKLQVTAPPVDGAANEAVVEVLAEWLAVPRRLVRIVRGATSREKEVHIESTSPELLVKKVRDSTPTG